MGCGSSKAIAVDSAPTQRVMIASKATDASETPRKGIETRNSSPGDSGVGDNDQDPITEDSADGEIIAGKNRPPTPELSITGKQTLTSAKGAKPVPPITDSKPPRGSNSSQKSTSPTKSSTTNSKSNKQSSNNDDGDDDSLDMSTRGESAVSTRSAPVMLERPSSRGGSAFEISFDGDSTNSPAGRPPRRLNSLERSNSGKKKRDELTLEELQQKLEAAEKRRKEYEHRLQDKMHQETKKAERIQQSLNSSISESTEDIADKTSSKENKVSENREAHLKMLRDRLKEKEDRAKQVRERKRSLKSLDVNKSE